jgi:hypothetical protein
MELMFYSLFFLKHLEDDETLVRIVRQFNVVAVNTLFWPSVALIAGWAFLVIAPVRMVFIIVSVWTIFMLAWWINKFMEYYLDVWIITDHGIIDLKWQGWFHRQSTRILYSDIQGVSCETKGISETLMGCGTISMEKISTGAAVSLPHVRNPRTIEKLILHQMEAYLHKKNLKNAKHVQDLLAEFVAEKINFESLPSKGKDSSQKKKAGMITKPV